MTAEQAQPITPDDRLDRARSIEAETQQRLAEGRREAVSTLRQIVNTGDGSELQRKACADLLKFAPDTGVQDHTGSNTASPVARLLEALLERRGPGAD